MVDRRNEHQDQATDRVVALHESILQAWNDRSARDYAAQFEDDAHLVGFDGTLIDGKAAIEKHLQQIFDDHRPATYVWKVLGVEPLTDDVSLLRAVAGMVPPGESDLKPERNAVQTLVARREGGRWQATLFQNTPAAFDGREEERTQLTNELREVMRREVGSR